MTASLVVAVRDADLGVLLVEDNDGDARLVELMLHNAYGSGFRVTRARSLSEAVRSVAETLPQCILLDLGLPDASGLEAVELLRDHAPTTPVVVFTGQADAELGILAVAAGAQDYLVKGNAVDETLTRAIRYAVVRKHAEDALYESEQTLAEAQHIAHLGSWQVDLATSETVWSGELRSLYAFSAEHTPRMDDLVERVDPRDLTLVRALVDASFRESSPFDITHRIVLPDGSSRWVRSQARFEVDATGAGRRVRGTVQDVTEQKEAEEALVHQALHDSLTGLPNRVLLIDRLTQALARLGRTEHSVGVLFVDIDRFKVVNDSLGHAAGDEMLLALARRLQGNLRLGDTLARFGGDEFVILCEALQGEAEAVGIGQRISRAMTQPLSWGGGELVVTVSVGIALASSPLVSPESLLSDADAAMYRAKEAGRAQAAVFADSMRTQAVGRLDTEVSLRRAITNGELELHYQPFVDLPSGQITGMEALVRWRHPDRGLIMPDHFIPIAEETGLIVPLGAWVLHQAAHQARAWQLSTGCDALTMAVNLSAAQIAQPDLLDEVATVLGESGLWPATLQLEITETVLMKDAPAAVKILAGLKLLGVQLSIDDFGTGYSSLSYLKRFPIDVLKIDRSFVEGLGVDGEDTAIVNAILSLANALNLSTVAEGVETTLQMHSLIELGCPLAQGYHFARPAPAADIGRLLATGSDACIVPVSTRSPRIDPVVAL